MSNEGNIIPPSQPANIQNVQPPQAVHTMPAEPATEGKIVKEEEEEEEVVQQIVDPQAGKTQANLPVASQKPAQAKKQQPQNKKTIQSSDGKKEPTKQTITEKQIILGFMEGLLKQKKHQEDHQRFSTITHNQQLSKDKKYLVITPNPKDAGSYFLTHTQKNGSYTFVNKHKLTKGTHEYSVSLTNVKDNSLLVGFGTGPTFELLRSNSEFPKNLREGIFYSCKSGLINKFGNAIDTKKGSVQGDKLNLAIDLQNNTFKLSKNNSLLFRCWIPEEFAKKCIYLIVRLINKDDKVEIAYV